MFIKEKSNVVQPIKSTRISAYRARTSVSRRHPLSARLSAFILRRCYPEIRGCSRNVRRDDRLVIGGYSAPYRIRGELNE